MPQQAPHPGSAARPGSVQPPGQAGQPGRIPQGGAARFPAHPTPAHFPTSPKNDGRFPWILGFLALVGFPGLSLLVPSLAGIIAGAIVARRNRVARRLGGRAILFGAANIVLMISFFTLLFGLHPWAVDRGYIPEEWLPATILLIALSAWVAFIGPITYVVLAIIAASKKVTRSKAARILNR